ncbi:hypothetical protein GCM10010521_35150 [Streptomyces rameus]|uniref:Uncharacterized protein n=1 Tax=Streptomyces rameus TaxID=68261 RepID=A0ABP6NGB4_9ACTN
MHLHRLRLTCEYEKAPLTGDGGVCERGSAVPTREEADRDGSSSRTKGVGDRTRGFQGPRLPGL